MKKKWTKECARKKERERRKVKIGTSLRSSEIGPWAFVGAKDKVDPRIASYTWVPKSWSFVKFHKVENFPTLVISNLKAI